MHIYYITGIHKVTELMICDEGDDGQLYLVANPELICYEGRLPDATHLTVC